MVYSSKQSVLRMEDLVGIAVWRICPVCDLARFHRRVPAYLGGGLACQGCDPPEQLFLPEGENV